MAKLDLRSWAAKGAEQRLVEIATEARAVFAYFPELRSSGRGFEAAPAGAGDDRGTARQRAPRKRRKRPAEARRRMSEAPKERSARQRAQSAVAAPRAAKKK